MSENFIISSFLDDVNICYELIEYFKKSHDKKPGKCGHDKYNMGVLDIDKKDSIDVTIDLNNPFNGPCIKKYIDELQKVCNHYIEIFPFCNEYSPWRITEDFNIQYYPPGGGFKIYHSERTRGNSFISNRHLVFMTYLNDVEDCGETEFYHQNLKIKPEKGKTLIWPADWTHTHRGIPSPTQEKYIVTGWFSFIDQY